MTIKNPSSNNDQDLSNNKRVRTTPILGRNKNKQHKRNPNKHTKPKQNLNNTESKTAIPNKARTQTRNKRAQHIQNPSKIRTKKGQARTKKHPPQSSKSSYGNAEGFCTKSHATAKANFSGALSGKPDFVQVLPDPKSLILHVKTSFCGCSEKCV